MDIHALGYLRLEATDLDAWERFLVDGLDTEVHRDGDRALRVRIDERPRTDRHHRIRCRPPRRGRLGGVRAPGSGTCHRRARARGCAGPRRDG